MLHLNIFNITRNVSILVTIRVILKYLQRNHVKPFSVAISIRILTNIDRNGWDFEAYFEYFQYHPKCQDFNDTSGDNEISSEKSRQTIFSCYFYLNIEKHTQKWVGFEAYFEYFQYHPKCQDFNDTSGDIEISSEKSRQIILNCYFHLNIDKLKQKWVGFEAYFEYFQYHPKCQDFTGNSGDIEISSEKSRQIILNCYFHLNIDKLKQKWMGFDA